MMRLGFINTPATIYCQSYWCMEVFRLAGSDCIQIILHSDSHVQTSETQIMVVIHWLTWHPGKIGERRNPPVTYIIQ